MTAPDRPIPPSRTPLALDRRVALQLLGGAGLAVLVGCSSDSSGGTAASTSTASGAGASTTAGGTGATGPTEAQGAIAEETAGPFPGDGSNGPDVLSMDGVVRRDITESIGDASGVAEGVPLTISLAIEDADSGDPIRGAAVYVWHCDREGRYSMYSNGAQDENYLRGVQPTGDDGVAQFDSIFPGTYAGRWPHVHFEVYESVDAATSGGSPIATSQIALPEDACHEAYATEGYEQSVTNLSQVSLTTDMVFADSYEQELGMVTGSADDGMEVTLPAGVSG